jgi:hypothetical protein
MSDKITEAAENADVTGTTLPSNRRRFSHKPEC